MSGIGAWNDGEESERGAEGKMGDKLRMWLTRPETVLEGDECLPLSAELRSIFSRFTLFRLNGQGVIFWRWFVFYLMEMKMLSGHDHRYGGSLI